MMIWSPWYYPEDRAGWYIIMMSYYIYTVCILNKRLNNEKKKKEQIGLFLTWDLWDSSLIYKELNITYDNGGHICCKHMLTEACLLSQASMCPSSTHVNKMTLSLVKCITHCVISILFPVWQLISFCFKLIYIQQL